MKHLLLLIALITVFHAIEAPSETNMTTYMEYRDHYRELDRLRTIEYKRELKQRRLSL